MRVEDYIASGGLRKALSQHGDEVYEALPGDRHRTIAERIFRALTEDAGDGRGVRRPTPFGSLLALADAPRDDVAAVVDAYRATDVAFLSPPRSEPLNDQTIVDLTHESVMRTWSRLKDWMAREAESARLYRRLLEEAQAHAADKGRLLAEPVLSYAELWLREEAPTGEWAQRYGPADGLVSVARFLAASRAAANLESEHEREIEKAKAEARLAPRMRRLAVIASIVAILAVLGFTVAIAAGYYAVSRTRALEALQAERSNQAMKFSAYQRAVAMEKATAAMANTKRANALASGLSAALKEAAKQRSIAQSEARKLSAQKQSQQLALLNDALLSSGNSDLYTAGLVAVDAYTMGQTNAAESSLLSLSETPDALGSVATPPWNLGAITGGGAYAVILAGRQQRTYGEPVTGALVVIDADDLGVRARLPNVTATLMCGAAVRPQIAIATGSRIDAYVITPDGMLRKAWSAAAGAVEALACTPQGGVVFVDASHHVRIAEPAGKSVTVASLRASARGLVLSPGGTSAAAVTGDGGLTLVTFSSGRVVTRPHAFTDLAHDCAQADGCGGAMLFANADSLYYYDAGAVHEVDRRLAGGISIPCDAKRCVHPRLVRAFEGELPLVLARGAMAYDAKRKAYALRYGDAGTTAHAVNDEDRHMWIAAYDPSVVGRPNPLGGGVATHAYHLIAAPMIGTVPDSRWTQSFLLTGSRVVAYASRSGYGAYDLDDLRTNYAHLARVSSQERLFDSADARHGAAFNYATGMLQVVDLLTDKPPLVVRTPRVPVDGGGHYRYEVDAAYDPVTGILTRFAYWDSSQEEHVADLTRYSPSGRIVLHLTLPQLLAHTHIPPATISSWSLTGRGNYIIVEQGDGMPDYLLRYDGTLVGAAYYIEDVSPDERIAFADNGSEANTKLTMFQLPQWRPLALTPIPTLANDFTLAPNGRLIAYFYNRSIKLYDPQSRLAYASALSPPENLDTVGGLSFSADSRYLLMSYVTTDGAPELAIYAVDPNLWSRSICLMAGQPLSPQTFSTVAGQSISYRDGCARYEDAMYR